MENSTRSFSGKPIAAIILIVLIGGGLYKWWPSDERAIRRQLDALADALTAPSKSTDTELARMTRFTELRDCFAPDVQVHFENHDVTSRDALLALVEQWTQPSGGLFVEFVDVTVSLAGDTADVQLTAKASTAKGGSASDPNGQPQRGDEVIDERDATIKMAKRDGDWLIMRVDSQEQAEKPSRP